MFTCCWSVKGGAGVSVVAAALALLASRAAPTTIVDLCGDQPAVLGIAEPEGLVAITPTLSLLLRDDHSPSPLTASAIRALGPDVIVDAGHLDRVDSARAFIAGSADRSLLVTRPCFLALRRAMRLGLRPHGVIVVTEPGRALRAADIASVVRAPVVAEVPFDAAISRAVDAGLLVARAPAALTTALGAAR